MPSSSSAACAVASAKVSLSESDTEDEVSSAIAESFVVPHWDDNARVTELANTLTALTPEGVPVHDTSMEDVVVSLRRIVTVTNSLAEGAVDFPMIPRNPVRPRFLRFLPEQVKVLLLMLCCRTQHCPDRNLEKQWIHLF